MIRLQLNPNVSIINSLRSIGYSLDVSIADIVDNSLAARANRVDIFFDIFIDHQDVKLAILDNGYGMSFDELKQAMTLGSKDPNEKRSDHDLGRFGLGLKTATFSQCKKLILISKQEDEVYGLSMDLDDNLKFQDWGVSRLNCEEICQLYQIELLMQLHSGTLVIWEKCDRLIEGQKDRIDEDEFAEQIYQKFAGLEQHLGLVFHRWIKPGAGAKKIEVFINYRKVEAIDPFASHHPATSEGEEEVIWFAKNKIVLQAYTLPHHSKCTKNEYEKNSLGDYMDSQGFYIYRNRRLLIGGDWFKLHSKRELSQLSRVLIDLPNNLDQQWKIDIKKSTVELPLEIKQQLKAFIQRLVGGSKRIYTSRGYRTKKEHIALWNRLYNKNQFSYELNIKHPLIEQFSEGLNSQQRREFDRLLIWIADYLPKDQIFADLGSNPHEHKMQHSSDDLAIQLANWHDRLKDTLSRDDFLIMVKGMEPFHGLDIDLNELLIKGETSEFGI